MEIDPPVANPDIPPGETLLWQGHPAIFRWAKGDGYFVSVLLLAFAIPAILLGMVLILAIGPFLWPNARNDEVALWGLMISPGMDVVLVLINLLVIKSIRHSSTRYLITDQSVILVKPYGEFFKTKLRKEKYIFRPAAIRSRQKLGSPGNWNLILGKERHFYEGRWFSSSREIWITVGIKECSDADKAERILDAGFGPGAGDPKEIRLDPAVLQEGRDENEPVMLDGPSKGSVLFIKGRNAPLVSLFSPKIPITYAGRSDEEILNNLLGPGETVLWKGRADYEPFRDLGQFQKVAAISGLLLSPLLIWLGIQVWSLRPSALLIVLGIGLVLWADAILFGRWSLRRIIDRAFFAITDRRVLLVHPFGPDLFPFEQPFYSLDRATIPRRVLCDSPVGPAIIFQSKETITGNDYHHVECLGIVGCPDWANAELILQSQFPIE